MSIADYLLTAIIYLIQKLILPLLPENMPFLSFETLTGILNSDVKNDLIFAFSGIGKLLPVNLILIIFLVIIFAEITLTTIKMGIFVINLVRGSGA
jgi:hypothetical protein